MNKKAIGLVLVGVIAGSSITAFAAGGRKIEVFDNVKKIIVNKINKPFTKGEEPFTYNGRTYVPLRYVSEALGENVDWDGKTGTVYIGDRYSTNYGYWGKDFNHMSLSAYNSSYVTYAHNTDSTRKNNIGEEFSNYLTLYSTAKRNTKVEFPLNGQYTRFKARLSTDFSTRDAKYSGIVKISIDGKEVYNTLIHSSDMPKDVSIDLTGANKITFEFNNNHDSYNEQKIIFGNGQFTKK